MSRPTATASSRDGASFIDRISCGLCLQSSSKPDTGKGKSKSTNSRRMSHGFHLVKGKSGHDMEDYHFAEYRKSRNHELGLFAIFDGHLGDSVASYLKDNLIDNILNEPIFWEDPAGAIKNAYCSTDNLILKNSLQLGPGGSTAVTAIVIDGKDLWVANIGDSRAVVCESGAANQLTVDHEPHTERKRIENRGGFVTTLPGISLIRVLVVSFGRLLGITIAVCFDISFVFTCIFICIAGDVPRVNGQLAVARAFGDQSLKAHLTSEPDVRHVPIDSTMEFVILASDGLWKVSSLVIHLFFFLSFGKLQNSFYC
ncbi:Probable protein phosphatase 2C 44 [Linum perenne]